MRVGLRVLRIMLRGVLMRERGAEVVIEARKSVAMTLRGVGDRDSFLKEAVIG
jgi:hypothetical protein